MICLLISKYLAISEHLIPGRGFIEKRPSIAPVVRDKSDNEGAIGGRYD